MDTEISVLYALISLIVGFIIFKKPLWGLYLAIIVELWLANYFLFGNYYLRLRLFILPFVFLLVITHMVYRKMKIKLNKTILTFLTIEIFMVVIVIVINIIHSLTLGESVTKVARAGVPIVITLLIYFLVNTPKRLKSYLFFACIILSVSSLFGIAQAMFGEPIYRFTQLLISKPDTYYAFGEAAGLALYSLPLAYQILCVLPIFISLYLYGSLHNRNNTFIIASLIVLSVTLFSTLIRSAIIGIGIWIFGITFLKRNDKKSVLRRKTVLLAIFAVIFVVSLSTATFKQVLTVQDQSAQDRVPLLIMGLKIASLYPFGIASASKFTQYSIEHFDFIADMKRAESVKLMSPHNQFLNTLLYWGIPGFILLIFLFIYKFKVLIKIFKTSKDNFIGIIAFGLLGVSIAYIVNSFFHNAGPFLGDIFYWYIIGLIPALVNISNKEKRITRLTNAYKNKCNNQRF